MFAELVRWVYLLIVISIDSHLNDIGTVELVNLHIIIIILLEYGIRALVHGIK